MKIFLCLVISDVLLLLQYCIGKAKENTVSMVAEENQILIDPLFPGIIKVKYKLKF